MEDSARSELRSAHIFQQIPVEKNKKKDNRLYKNNDLPFWEEKTNENPPNMIKNR